MENDFKKLNCCDCGVEFYIPAALYDKRLDDGEIFFCPSGHQQHFTRSYKQMLEETKERLAKNQEYCRELHGRIDRMERSKRALKAWITRLKKKAKIIEGLE